MTAIVQACKDLASGACDMALAGGSSYMMIPETSLTMSKAGFLSIDGRSKSFAANADGYGRGEGAGILILKPLEKALKDNDSIHAVITAHAQNQDGRTVALPVPSSKAQERLIEKILTQSGNHPDEISAVEAHGAGTPVGDPLEANAIISAIAKKRTENAAPLPIGSIKANIGHLEATSGVAGTLRAMLSIENRQLPPWPLRGDVAPFITESPLHLPKEGMALGAEKKDDPLRILVNSFGYGGSNAAILLRGLTEKERQKRKKKSVSILPLETEMLVLSAATPAALALLSQAYADYLSEQGDLTEEQAQKFWVELCQNVFFQRDFQPYRVVLLRKNRSLQEIAVLLRRFAQRDQTDNHQSEKQVFEYEGFFQGEGRALKAPILVAVAPSPDKILRQGAEFLLNLSEKITPRTSLLLADFANKAEIVAEIKENGNFAPLSPISSLVLQLASLEYLSAMGMLIKIVSQNIGKQAGVGNVPALLMDYFNDRIDLTKLTKILSEEMSEIYKSLAQSPRLSETDIVLILGVGGNFPHALRLKSDKDLKDSFIEVTARLMAEGGDVQPIDPMLGRTLSLPPYPLGLESFPGPEALAAKRDRLDLTIHPLLGTEDENGLVKGWQADLTKGFLPWLSDHALERSGNGLNQGSDWLFPFAAFVEAAVAAQAELLGNSTCMIERMQITVPLFPARDQTSLIKWHFNEKSKQLELVSQIPSSLTLEDTWAKHGDVYLSESLPWQIEKTYAQVEAEIATQEMEEVTASFLYRELRRSGILYGPLFRTVQNLKCSGRGEGACAVGHLKLEDSLKDDTGYFLHPTLLDGAFQLAASLLPDQEQEFYAPCALERFIWLGGKKKDKNFLSEIQAKITLREFSSESIKIDGEFYTMAGQLIAEMRGLECRSPVKKKQIQLIKGKWESLPPLPLLAEPRKLCVFGEMDSFRQEVLEKLSKNGTEIQHVKHLEALSAFLEAEKEQVRLVYFPPVLEASKKNVSALLGAMSSTLEMLRKIIVAAAKKSQFSLLMASPGIFAGLEDFISKTTTDLLPKELMLSPLAGFVRSARVEYPNFDFRVIFWGEETDEDLPSAYQNSLTTALAAELISKDKAETEVFLTAEGRYGVRATALKAEEIQQNPLTKKDLEAKQSSIALVQDYGGRKMVAGLGWENRHLSKPSRHQVKVKTLSAGLNFKDLLNVMALTSHAVLKNTHSAGILGMEAVVEIVECGEAVKNFTPGMICLSFHPGAFETHRLLDPRENLLFPLPEEVNELFSPEFFLKLAGFPIATLTAWGALVRLAHLEKGESVLIHSAGGGVGQMALQVARHRGARIFATAGSKERRAWLAQQKNVEAVFDSRTLAFFDGILEATGGKGVDVALNSLTGEALTATLKLMAPFGRFVEIGKRDIIEGGALELAPFNENLSFFSFDLDRLMKARPEIFAQDFETLCRLVQAGELSLPECKIFPLSKVQEAFRHFASDRHLGRIILDFSKDVALKEAENHQVAKIIAGQTDPSAKENAPKEQSNLLAIRDNPKNCFFADPKAAHLVTGATGGFGLTTLRWLLKGGARSLHAMSRTSPKDFQGTLAQSYQELLEMAQELGAEIIFHQADVSDETLMEEILKTITKTQRLGGIYHAAGVTKDVFITEMAEADISEVLLPKVGGAVALWKGFKKLGIQPDHFILYSSLAGFTGNSGQSSYASANVFLDHFAGFLRRQGIAALSVGWGAIHQGGMMKQEGNAATIFRRAGIVSVDAAKALDSMAVLSGKNLSWGICASVDWSAFFRIFPAAGRETRFCFLHEKDNTSSERVLENLPPSERKAFTVKAILEEIPKSKKGPPKMKADNEKMPPEIAEIPVVSRAFGLKGEMREALDWRTGWLDQLLLNRAYLHPEQSGFRFLAADASVEQVLDPERLDMQARKVAGMLKNFVPQKGRVVLLAGNTAHYLTGFFGAIYAGCVPVSGVSPALAGSVKHLRHILQDSKPAAVFGARADVESFSILCPEFDVLWLPAENAEAAEPFFNPLRESREDVVFIQYTSGTQGAPRGVGISNEAIAVNLDHQGNLFSCAHPGPGVIWLPFTHDMGLIGSLLMSLACGECLYVQKPEDFIKNPMSWLEAISTYQLRFSMAPIFACELLASIAEKNPPSLDLSSWRVAPVGSGPVHSVTLERFIKAFEPNGFEASTFCPSYGMAETTLLMTGRRGMEPKGFYRHDLAQGHAIPAEKETEKTEKEVRLLIGCGKLIADHKIQIVNEKTDEILPEGDVGEIWVSGPCVVRSYIGKSRRSVEKQGQNPENFCVDEKGLHWFRTGDMGFLKEKELFILGRIEETVIEAGQVYDPYDLAEEIRLEIRKYHSLNGTDNIVIYKEAGRLRALVESSTSIEDSRTVALAAARRLYHICGTRSVWVSWVAPGALPRTPNAEPVEEGKAKDSSQEKVSKDPTMELPMPEPPSPMKEKEPQASPQANAPLLLSVAGPERIRFDFNDGCRVDVPSGKKWRVQFRDTGTDTVLFDQWLEQGGRVQSAKRYYVPFELTVWEDGKEAPVLQHRCDLFGKKVTVRMELGGLGDHIAWVGQAIAFGRTHGAKLTCVVRPDLAELLAPANPDVSFVTAENAPTDSYATYKVLVFFDDHDRNWQPLDYRQAGLGRMGAYMLGLTPENRCPEIDIDDTPPIKDPYVVIAVQGSGLGKMWNNPYGWRHVIKFLKALGYRVICIDQARVTGGMASIGTIFPMGLRMKQETVLWQSGQDGSNMRISLLACPQVFLGWHGQ
ncbi:polyketide synthase [Lasius niger]|uniref:Polyketide synthase n=1 Tax=Lasius niger TaxID=67767 RepID=A0A0J7NUY5_LASNI|nr:polyketide synthase [Lasius niger]